MPVLLQSWWIFALRGVLVLMFGVLALTMPAVTLIALIALFSIYALLSGVVYLVGAFRHRRHLRGAHAVDWWLLVLLGAVSLAAGVLAAMRPALAALVLVVVIGVNALVGGVFDLISAVRLRGHLYGGEWLLVLGALASIVFGTVLVALPGIGALALVWLISVYALVTGLMYLALAYRAYRDQSGDARVRRWRSSGQQDRRLRERRTAATGHA